MNLRVAVFGKVKGHESRSRSESESEQGVKSAAADAKPSDLPLIRESPNGTTRYLEEVTSINDGG